MFKVFTNKEIFEIGNILKNGFNGDGSHYIPAKINFYIQKNKKKIFEALADIEEARKDIIINYGVQDYENESMVTIPPENVNKVNEEIKELLDIQQELDIHMISLETIEDLEFTLEQMEALMFMIEE